MANTTDIMITAFIEEEDAVAYINEKTNLSIKLVSDSGLCGGPKHVSFDAYATCQRTIGKEAIDALIESFMLAPFHTPEYAVMIISDDDDVFDGIVTRKDVNSI